MIFISTTWSRVSMSGAGGEKPGPMALTWYSPRGSGPSRRFAPDPKGTRSTLPSGWTGLSRDDPAPSQHMLVGMLALLERMADARTALEGERVDGRGIDWIPLKI